MNTTIVSKEDLELVQKAQHAILKLDTGKNLEAGSQEHLDLSRAITRLSGLILFDTRPLTENEREHAGWILEKKDVV